MFRSFSLISVLSVFSLFLGSLAASEVKVGDKIESLSTKSGRSYEQVIIKEILSNGLRISHSSGSATIVATDLPQYASLFAAIAAPAIPSKLETVVTAPPSWVPTNSGEVADCSLLVKVSKGESSGGSISAWAGSAFLCNQGGVTYIYSNVHNFDGAIDFTIEDAKGKKIDDFESVEVASDGHANWKSAGYGGDIVRIRLKKFREKALSIDPMTVTEANAKGRKILVTGNTGGRGVITQLTGIITGIQPNYIITHNAATEGGNSGSPIVDLESYKVVGILTWGFVLPDPVNAVWKKKSEQTREGLNFGAALATIGYTPTTFKQLYSQRVVMNGMKRNIRLLGLLDTLIPTKEGLFVEKNVTVMGDYTVADLLAESPDHPVVAELVALDKKLSARAGSNIGTSNQDMLKSYVATYRKCLLHISSQREALENANSATFFMKCSLRRSRILDVCRAYESLSAKCLTWYTTQTGTGGKALPLAQRMRLPPFRSGLEGLGLKNE